MTLAEAILEMQKSVSGAAEYWERSPRDSERTLALLKVAEAAARWEASKKTTSDQTGECWDTFDEQAECDLMDALAALAKALGAGA